MTKILLLSDTHGFLDDRILKYIDDRDEIWHAGDIGDLKVTDRLVGLKPLRAVFGNIDGQTARRIFPKDQKFKCEDVNVWITHIGGYPGNYPSEIKNELKVNPIDLFICGHSHILKVMYDKTHNHLHMNPGACGNSGFHQVKTMLRFTIEGKVIKDLEVIELGKRGEILT